MTRAEQVAKNGTQSIITALSRTAKSSVVVNQAVVGRQSELKAPSAPAASAKTAVSSDLTSSQLNPIVDEAIRRWAAAGLSAQDIHKLRNASISIADLPDLQLGWAAESGIAIDEDAAGYGWFVDSTPASNEEFQVSKSNGQLIAADSAAADRMDLLTVVEHEMGHFLGLDDASANEHGLMSGTLSKGLRRLPETAAVDAVLAINSWNDWL
jgi:hypothetical protein